VYVEIQGHTDNLGSAAYNLKLGQVRAEAVMGISTCNNGFPLHRMNVISYRAHQAGRGQPHQGRTSQESPGRARGAECSGTAIRHATAPGSPPGASLFPSTGR